MRQLGAMLFGLVLTTVAARADEVRLPVSGAWKILLVNPQAQEVALAIVKIEVKDGKAEATLLATGPNSFKDAAVTAVHADAASIHLTIRSAGSDFRFAAYTAEKQGRPRLLRGSLQVRGSCDIVLLERTFEKELDPQTLVAEGAGAEELKKILSRNETIAAAARTAIREKYGDKPAAYLSERRQFASAAQTDDVKMLRSIGTEFLRRAADYGREAELSAATEIASGLAKKPEGVDAAIEMARRAEKLFAESDPLMQQLLVIKVLDGALRKAATPDVAAVKAIEERRAKLEERLDAEYEKTSLPFKPEPYTERKTKNNRVVVVEQFSNAHSTKSVASDMVFDALLKTFSASEVVLLSYHLHAKHSDALANTDGELYAALAHVDETPTLLLNGKPAPKHTGDAQEFYKTLRGLLSKEIEAPRKIGLDVAVKRDDERIEVVATVAALADKTAARLRVLLVEDVVRYSGLNGRRLHHNVVRSSVADVNATLAQGASKSLKFAVALDDLRKKLADNLDLVNKDDPFPTEERPLALKRLKIVVLLQDEGSREILDALQADVPERRTK